MTSSEDDLRQALSRWLNRLAKWRMVFAGWQLGTRTDVDPEARAVRDHREVTLMLRAEMNALVALLIGKDLMSMEDWMAQLTREAQLLDEAMSRRFPGMRSSEDGMIFTQEAAEWMAGQGWKP